MPVALKVILMYLKTGTMNASTLIILIAPNVSQLMGGEGIKALQTFEYFKRAHPNTIQITHGRNREHIENDLKLKDVYFVEDDAISLFMWKSKIFRMGLDVWFSKKAIVLAERLAAELGVAGGDVVIHQTGPNSPILPRSISKQYPNSFGPINGNIHYPPVFHYRESYMGKLKRLLHYPLQKLNALAFNQLSRAEIIFAAGGERTTDSLIAAGCEADHLIDTIDCGVEDRILERPRITHDGENLHFVHFGRLVNFKGTDLIIRALAKTSLPVKLDIIGDGPELQHCKQFVKALGLTSRVSFIPWRSHGELLDSLADYRAFILPSLADSNGIVVQEAMALGLPTICLDWGGPQLLVDHQVNGYLVPVSEEEIILSNMAACIDDLAHNGHKAERFSKAARSKAQAWQWTAVAEEWLSHLSSIASNASELNTKSVAGDDVMLEDANRIA